MSANILTLSTPLEERIDRWATSGKANRIVLHPSDYIKLSDTKRETIAAKYNLPVEVLGGDRAIGEFLSRNKNEEKRELESMAADTVSVNLNEIEQGDE